MKQHFDNNILQKENNHVDNDQFQDVQTVLEEMKTDVVPSADLLSKILETLPMENKVSIETKGEEKQSVFQNMNEWFSQLGKMLLPLGAVVAVVLLTVYVYTGKQAPASLENTSDDVSPLVLDEQEAVTELDVLSLEHINAEALAFSVVPIDFSQLLNDLEYDMSLLADIDMSLDVAVSEISQEEDTVRETTSIQSSTRAITEEPVVPTRTVSSSLETTSRIRR